MLPQIDEPESVPTAAQVERVVESQFPALGPVRARYLGEGYDSTAFEVNGSLVFRFPKRQDVEQQLFIEERVLGALAGVSPLPIPRYEFRGVPSPLFPRHFGGYVCLPGLPAITLSPTAAVLSRWAPLLGTFLGFLHSTPASSVLTWGVPEMSARALLQDSITEGLSDLEEVQAAIPDLPAAECRELFARLAASELEAVKPVLTHGDLAAEHVLVEPQALAITGVIDWSEVALSDPAHDLAGMIHWGGPGFLREVLAAYPLPSSEGLVERARLLAVCRGIGDLLFGLERGREEYLAAGRQALRHCFEH